VGEGRSEKVKDNSERKKIKSVNVIVIVDVEIKEIWI